MAKALITGIGSVPFYDVDEAFNFSFKHDIPFFPQIPNIHANMCDQVKDSNFTHLDEFVSEAKRRNIKLIKIQIAGPCTCNLPLQNLKKCIEEIQNKTQGIDILFCLDEPILTNHYFDFYKELVSSKAFKMVALHSCKKLELFEINELTKIFDYVFYDAILNKELHLKVNEASKLCPGIVDYLGNEIEIDRSKFKIISASCGLLNSPTPYKILEILKN